MEFQTTEKDGMVVLAISGELDAITVFDLRPEITRVVDEIKPRHVKLDFSALRLIDATGIGAFVDLFKRNRANGGTFEIVGLHGQPEMIFQVLHLDQVFGRKKTEEAGDAPSATSAPSA
jgi:anti-anti-sigma factor